MFTRLVKLLPWVLSSTIPSTAWAQSSCYELAARSYAAAGPISDVAVGDVDGDGNVDFVTSSASGPGVSILRGNGAAFELAAVLSALVEHAVALGDLDHDGDLDVVTCAYQTPGSNFVFVRANLGQGAFAAPVSYAVASNPLDVALGDLNGDGFLDIACADWGASGITILRNVGNGTFAPLTSLVAGSVTSMIVLDDVDQDGDLDLIAPCDNASKVVLFRNNGSGGFAPVVNLPTAQNVSGLAVADVDGDGKRDIVTTATVANLVTWRRNLGAGAFAPEATLATFPRPVAIAAADLDADGDVDFFIGSDASRAAVVLSNQGGASFATGARVPCDRGIPILADVDHDGLPDFLSWAGNRIRVFPNDHGAVHGPVTYPVGLGPVACALADFDGDARTDMAVLSLDDARLTILAGQSNASFAPLGSIAVGAGPRAIVSGDIDGDGDQDVVFVEDGTATVSVRTNNGAGVFGAGTPYALATYGSTCCLADVDQDGDLDLLVTQMANALLLVCKNAGNGVFGAPLAISAGRIQALRAVDVDGDGDLDVVATIRSTFDGYLEVLRNPGNGNFVYASGAYLGVAAGALACGDLDQDGDVDVVALSSGLVTLTNDGTGQLAIHSVMSSEADLASEVALGDGDGDGDLDVFATQFLEVSQYVNDGAAGLTRGVGFPLGDFPRNVSANDLDLDGDADLVGVLGTTHVAFVTRACRTSIQSFCAGDGSGAACPCGNSGGIGRGCAGSAFAYGARLSAIGVPGASGATDSLVLVADGCAGPGLFVQGTSVQGGGAGVAFGDGLLCVGGAFVRLGVGVSIGGSASLPNAASPTRIHVAGGPLVAGDVRHYQCWYRDALAFCTSATFNLTQGLTITWAP